jgi:hypothetical protein
MPNQRDEAAALLAVIRADWSDELSNVSLRSVWPYVADAAAALADPDPRHRGAVADRLIDAVLHAVGDTHARIAACDAVEDEG